MTNPRVACLAVAVLISLSAVAHAQVLGTCSGGITGVVGLAAPGADGQLHTITQGADKLIGSAACLCGSSGLSIDIALTAGFASGTENTATVWVGQGCDDYPTRVNTSNPTCHEIVGPTGIVFDAGGGHIGATAPHIEIPLDVATLVSPGTRDCTAPSNGAAITNSIYVFVGNDQSNPDASCEADLTEQMAGPPAPLVTVAPAASTPSLVVQSAGGALQVLCAPTDGGAATTQAPSLYSTCLQGGVLDWRTLALDAAGQGPPQPSSDAVGATTVALPAPLDHLDPRWLVPMGAYIGPESGPTTLALDALPAGSFNCAVLAIDEYGNATPSNVVSVENSAASDAGAPSDANPTDPPEPARGCSMGGAGPVVGSWPLALLLAAVVRLSRFRRQRRRVS